MNCKILIPQAVAQEGLDFLITRGYELVTGTGTKETDLIRDVADCDAILLRLAYANKPVLEAGNRLKIVARSGAGYDNVDLETAEKLGIWVTNAPLSTNTSVSEFVIAAMLELAKGISHCTQAMRQGEFYSYKSSHLGLELEGKTIGIIGFGRIGEAIAKKAALGFDMKVLAYGPRLLNKNLPDYVTACSLDELLMRSDFVSLNVPSTSETVGMIGIQQLSKMQKNAYLINTSRGEIVNESALLHTLESGLIAGAALDVFHQEPLSLDSPLFTLPNVLLTPHMASSTTEAMAKMSLHAAMEIDRVLSGEKPYWPVNQPKKPCPCTI